MDGTFLGDAAVFLFCLATLLDLVLNRGVRIRRRD